MKEVKIMKVDVMDMQYYIEKYRDQITRIENEIDEMKLDYWSSEELKDELVENFILSKMKENGIEVEDNEDDEFIDF